MIEPKLRFKIFNGATRITEIKVGTTRIKHFIINGCDYIEPDPDTGVNDINRDGIGDPPATNINSYY